MASGIERRLTAILSADVVGYSRLMAEDEEATLRTLTAYREQLGVLVRQHRGRVVDTAGDNLLAEFPSALDATRCALEIQRVVRARNLSLPAERRMEFRIGIHLGDVMAEGERIYGDGVNIAARLESLAEAGGVCISAAVHEQVHSKLELRSEDLGEREVKNIPQPVRVYRVRPGVAEKPAADQGVRGRSRLRRAVFVTASALSILALGIWATWPRPLVFILDQAGWLSLPVDPPLPDKPSIAVLPFTNMSDDPDQEYFAEGISEEITAELSRNDALFVISRTSAFTYKGQAVKLDQVSRELGVRYVLEGSVRKAAGRVRITAQLIDATRDVHLWSEQYDRDLADIFALQSEMAREIQTALRVTIHDTERRRSWRRQTGDLGAYDAFLKGIYHFKRFRRADNEEARYWGARAVELDSGFAAAHALYGNTFAVEYALGWSREPELLTRAETSARRALELDERTADAWLVLANVATARREFGRARELAEKATEVEPNWHAPYQARALALGGQGRFVSALQSMNRALRHNPRGPVLTTMMLGFVNYGTGNRDRAVELLEKARRANPDIVISRIVLAAHYESEGRHTEARALVREILAVVPDLTADQAAEITSPFASVVEVREPLRRAGLP